MSEGPLRAREVVIGTGTVEECVMATVGSATAEFTVADIADLLGPIPFRRIVADPPPGTATEADVIAHLRKTGRVCELVDGILVEKAVSWETSVVAAEIIRLAGNFIRERRLGGKIAGVQGMTWLPVGRLRGPEVSYVSPGRLPSGPRLRPYPELVPDLAVEVLSPGNTRKETDGKLDDYFASGVGLVWIVDPRARAVRVLTGRETETTLGETDTLDGGTVLPGFAVKVAELFSDPAT